MLSGLGLDDPNLRADQNNVARWPKMRALMAQRFATKTRDEWDQILSASDTCAAPVVEVSELTANPHLTARDVYVRSDDGFHTVRAPRVDVAAPAPRLVAQPSATTEILTGLGFTAEQVDRLRVDGVVADPK